MMLPKPTILQVVFTAITLLQVVNSQGEEDSIPADLAKNFDSSVLGLQVSYNNTPGDGFLPGARFQQKDVLKAPTFGLSQSSGITPSDYYTIMMLDDTCPNNRVVHFFQNNFKWAGSETILNSSADPAFDYLAPGGFGERGVGRHYSFLLWKQFEKMDWTALSVAPYMISDRGEANDLHATMVTFNMSEEADAGVGMWVNINLDGNTTTNCPTPTPTPEPTSQAGYTFATTMVNPPDETWGPITSTDDPAATPTGDPISAPTTVGFPGVGVSASATTAAAAIHNLHSHQTHFSGFMLHTVLIVLFPFAIAAFVPFCKFLF